MRHDYLAHLVISASLVALTFGCGTVKPSENKASAIKESNDAFVMPGDESPEKVKPKGKESEEGKPPKKELTPEELNAEALSLAAFEQTVYPILRANCQGCHAETQSPFLGHENAETAFHAVLDNNKVNWNDISKSRLVVRLAENLHHCWGEDCEKSAGEMQTAIAAWKEKSDAAGFQDTIEEGLLTERKALRAADISEPEVDPGTMVQLASDYSDIRAPMTLRNDDADGEILTHIVTPLGSGGRIQPNAQGGEAYYTFEVEVAGTYAIYGRVKAPDGMSDSFHLRMDNGPIVAWGTGITGGDWVWNRANQANGMTELSFDLTPGTHTVMVKQREERTQINRIALTNQLADFSGAEVASEVFELRYDLSELTGKNATLVVAVDVWDEPSATYRLMNPRIETDSDIYIKDVMPRINGQWNPQHSTFRLVDQTISAPGASLSTATMILIGEQGWDLDELSFSFGDIK